MSNVKLIRTAVGEDIIGEILESPLDRSHVRVKNPCQIGLIMTPSGKPTLNMQKMIPFSDAEYVDMKDALILYITSVDTAIEMKYNEIFGNIIVTQPKIITG